MTRLLPAGCPGGIDLVLSPRSLVPADIRSQSQVTAQEGALRRRVARRSYDGRTGIAWMSHFESVLVLFVRGLPMT